MRVRGFYNKAIKISDGDLEILDIMKSLSTKKVNLYNKIETIKHDCMYNIPSLSSFDMIKPDNKNIHDISDKIIKFDKLELLEREYREIMYIS